MNQDKFVNIIQKIVKQFLDRKGFFIDEWHLGKVQSVNVDNTLNLYIDGSTNVTVSVPCNPDLVFVADDYVWVHYVNRNPNNLFVPYKRQITS